LRRRKRIRNNVVRGIWKAMEPGGGSYRLGTLPALRAASRSRDEPGEESRMAMQVRTSGCLFSIIASVVLTVLVNVLLRGCSGY
jgi:hypothetical protein